MFRMNGMTRCHGWQRAANVHDCRMQEVERSKDARAEDERYDAVPWMAKSGECSRLQDAGGRR